MQWVCFIILKYIFKNKTNTFVIPACFWRESNQEILNNDYMNTYYDYILASGKKGTLYNGVTNNLIKRVAQHKRKEVKGFAEKYEVNKLVWYEQTNDIRIAIKREKQIKKWNRKWKIRLIEKENPEWNDLFFEIGGTEDKLDPNFLI